MKRPHLHGGFVAVLASTMFLAATTAGAEPIVAGPTVLIGRAFQDVTLLANTPFNPTGSDIVIDDLFGDGSITLNRAVQVGSTIDIPTATGVFFGSHPLLGDFAFGAISPLGPGDFNGTIDSVTQDPSDPGFATGDPSSFRSGDLSFGGNSFGFEFLTGPAAGLKLFTDPATPFRFSAVLDGLPPSEGTVLMNSGPETLDVLFDGMVVARSSDRRILIRAVPEPASLALLGLGAIGFWGVARRRRRTGH